MPIFLQPNDLYRIIQRELPPDDVYPDSGDPTRFYSTADSFATARVLSDYYGIQQQTYNNYFPVSATGANNRLSDHEITYFGYNLSASLSIAQRLALLLAQIRRQVAPTPWDILTLALTFVPVGVSIGIAPYNDLGDAQNWQLGVSLLGINTNLSYNDSDPVEGPKNAFGYEVRIFDYTLTPEQYTALDLALTKQEPARSFHVIRQNLNRIAMGFIYPDPNATQYDLVTVAQVDPLSKITGYTGWSYNKITNFLVDEMGDYITDENGNLIEV